MMDKSKWRDIIKGKAPPSEVEIRYIVFGGVDHRIDKRLHIYGDGSVKYSTIGDDLTHPIEEKGEYSLRMDRSEVIDLLRRFDENGFLELRQEKELVPDSVYSEICLKIGRDEHCVYYYHDTYMQKYFKMEKPPRYGRIEEELTKIIDRAKRQQISL